MILVTLHKHWFSDLLIKKKRIAFGVLGDLNGNTYKDMSGHKITPQLKTEQPSFKFQV